MLSKLQISKPTIFLSTFLFITQFINGYGDAGSISSPIADYWYIFALYWALGWWFIADSRKHGNGWIGGHLDMGMLLFAGWIFIIPYYLFKTRGLKALYTLGLLLGMTIGAYLEGAILYFFLNAF